jgi:ATP-dependent Clp protease ATP-binding subunit ClpA
MRGVRSESEDHVTENRALKQAIRRRMEVTGEKYTEARRAVLDWNSGATKPRHIQEAERLGHDYIGCEHLLLGILADEGDVAARTLTAHGVTLARVKRRTAEIVGDGGRGSVRWSYSPRAVVVRELAEVEAERLGAALPSPTHTLLAILTEGEGVPNALFGEFEVDLSKLRADLLQQLDIPAGMREMYLRQRNASDRAREQERPPEG